MNLDWLGLNRFSMAQQTLSRSTCWSCGEMQGAQAMINAGVEGPMNLQAAAAGSVASLLTVSLLNSTPMPAGLDGEEMRLRAQFIKTDLQHDVLAQAISKTASTSAEASMRSPSRVGYRVLAVMTFAVVKKAWTDGGLANSYG